MKNFVASVGLAVFGATAVHGASLSEAVAEPNKLWSASITLRGFYDDNINSSHSDKQDTFGFEASPSLGLHFSKEQTTFSAAYTYSFKYYDTQPIGNADKYDQTHTFSLALDHKFDPNNAIHVQDSFVIGQEPDILRAGATFSTFQRIPGDNIRNYGIINYNLQLSPLFGLEAGYANQFFDYKDDGDFGDPPRHFGTASYSGLLDRLEHMAHLDFRWTLQPTTVGLFGYQYREVDYTADRTISDELNPDTGDPYKSDVRDSRAHYVYLGADHTFRPDFSGSIRAGASFVDYPNDPSDESEVAPYVTASLKYFYLPDCSLDAGVSYDRHAIDQFSVNSNNDSITRDAQGISVWGRLNHRITRQLYGTIDAQVQNSNYNGGTDDGESDLYFLLGLQLEYRFNPHLSAHVGYNYDNLNSDLKGRDFDRNRVYVGITAGY